MIYLLMILLIFLLIVCYFLNQKKLLSPAIIFTVSFCFSTFWAMIYADVWELENMYENTFFVIFGGVLEFIIVSFLVQQIFLKKNGNKFKYEETEVKSINVDILIKLICLVFSIIVLFLNVKYICEVTNGSLSTLKQSISDYDQLVKFSDEIVEAPKFLGISQIIITCMSYWFMYIIINNFIANKKIDFLSVCIVFMCIIISLINGGRNNTVNLILAAICMFYIISKKKGAFVKKLKLKTSTKVILVLGPTLFLVSFPTVAKLLGRNITQNTMDYLAIYCGAEIKNLDLYLVERDFSYNYKNSSENCQTFNCIINWVGPKLGLIDEKYKLDIPFREINGYSLGNVYTTFYPYVYDFGYVGVIFCVALMALIAQFVFEKCMRAKLKDSPNIWILIYGYMFSSLVLSFFSNKFYEQNFNKGLVLGIIFWILANFFFVKFKSKKTVN